MPWATRCSTIAAASALRMRAPRSGTTMGRWSWCSDAWDFDHDGFPDLYIANGMISGTTREDLNSFFWRQVVANSPKESGPNYELRARMERHQRTDSLGWHVERLRTQRFLRKQPRRHIFGCFRNRRAWTSSKTADRSRSPISITTGELEVILKNRNSPQLRVLKNVMREPRSCDRISLGWQKEQS